MARTARKVTRPRVMPSAAPTWRPYVAAVRAPMMTPPTIEPARAVEAAAGAGVHRRREEDPGEQSDEPTDDDPDDERSDPDADGQRRRVADRRVELVQQAEPEHDARDDRDDDRRTAPPGRRGCSARGGSAGTATRAIEANSEKAVDDPPAHRPEQPLAEEQGATDDEQHDGEEDDDEGRGRRERGPVRSRRRSRHLGLGELDVGLEQEDGRLAGRRIWARSPGGALRGRAALRRRWRRRRTADGGGPGGDPDGGGPPAGGRRRSGSPDGGFRAVSAAAESPPAAESSSCRPGCCSDCGSGRGPVWAWAAADDTSARDAPPRYAAAGDRASDPSRLDR